MYLCISIVFILKQPIKLFILYVYIFKQLRMNENLSAVSKLDEIMRRKGKKIYYQIVSINKRSSAHQTIYVRASSGKMHGVYKYNLN